MPAVCPIAGKPYRRREPEQTVLHQALREHLNTLLVTNDVPRHVRRALRGYVDCGVLARGFVRVRCPDCREENQRRVERALVHRGLYEVIEEEPEQDALFALQAASAANRVAMGVRAGRKVRKLQLGSTRERKLPPLCAEASYFNLHAGVRVRAQDRAALDRLCRYVARPPLSHARLKRHDDGDIALALKRSIGTSMRGLRRQKYAARRTGNQVSSRRLAV